MTKRITLNEDLIEIMERLGEQTGLSVGSIANRLLGSHLADLHELDAFLEAHPGAGSLHQQALNLMQSFGPESIMEGLSRIAPNYLSLAARFEREFAETFGSIPFTSQ
jgi:hypothetical protein